MAEAKTAVAAKPVWIDLASSDPSASHRFYSSLFGWDVEVSPDPQYGGYALAKIGGKDVAGIGPKQTPEAPDAWMIYIGTADLDELSRRAAQAGGTVVSQPFAVGDQGRMAVFQDPSGAFISGWESQAMRGFQTDAPGALGWIELNARGVDRAIPFYERVFGWTHTTSDMGAGQPPYHQFTLDGENVAGAWEMNPMVPAEVPSYWMAYFGVDDVDRSYRKAIDAGGREMLPPRDFPGGRFAIVSDPQGASFGLLKMAAR
jgi:predicted enzyme related to lactoylglutathione lyase